MTPSEVRYCPLDAEASALLADLYTRHRLSGRAHDRTLRLAQTIADLADRDLVGEEQMAQALQMRRRERA